MALLSARESRPLLFQSCFFYNSKSTAQSTSAYLVTTIDDPASSLRTKEISNNVFAVAFIGKASPDGTFFNPETAEKLRSSAREYGRLPVRIWDHYVTAEKNAIWYTRLEKHECRYGISSVGFVNALKSTRLEHPYPDPLEGGDFDLSAKGSFSLQMTRRLIQPPCLSTSFTTSLSRHIQKTPYRRVTRSPHQTKTAPLHHQNSHRMANPPRSSKPKRPVTTSINRASSSCVIPTT